ncbi:MAG: hypothetical protein ABJN72_10055 [Sulfitobacter sp.]
MTGEPTKTAREISENLLEITAKAMLACDFDTFSTCFHVPHFISSAEDKTVLETREDLRRIFLAVCQDYEVMRITNLVRILEVAEFQSPTRIQATHIQHLMVGNDRVGPAMPCYSILECFDGHWKVASSQYGVDSNTTVGHVLKDWHAPQSKQQ